MADDGDPANGGGPAAELTRTAGGGSPAAKLARTAGGGGPAADFSHKAGGSSPTAELAQRWWRMGREAQQQWWRLGRGEWQREEETGLAATTHRGVDLSSISMVLELDLSSPSSNRSPRTSASWFPTIPSPAARRRGGGPLELGRGCGCDRRLRAVLPCFSHRRGPGRCRPPWEKE
jgi:hypothetical protein